MSNLMTNAETAKLFVKQNLFGLTGTKTIRVTPELAEQWLDWNGGNRKVSKPHVRRLVSEIKAGNWKLNGQCLIMSDAGRLLDGQHRLTAIVESGVSLLVDVRFGIEPSTFTTIDEGKKRSSGDVFKIKGYENYNTLAAASRVAMAYERGYSQRAGGADQVPTNSVLLEWVEGREEMIEYVSNAISLYVASDRMILTASKIAAYLYITSQLDEDDSSKFFSALATGIGFSGSSDPVYQLRKKLIRVRMDQVNKVPQSVEQAWIIIAWNAWRAGKELKQLRYSPGAGQKPPRFK